MTDFPVENLVALLHDLAARPVGSQSKNDPDPLTPPLTPPLNEELRECLLQIRVQDLTAMPGKGLAHDHITLGYTGLLLRIPRQSQLALNASDNLQYQAGCFARMFASGHTPACYAVLPPSEQVPMGALLVERIAGRVPAASADFQSIATTLASIHRLALPAKDSRAPLYDQQNSLADTLSEVRSQAAYLNQVDISSGSRGLIDAQLELAETELKSLRAPPSRLISFDAHPGNYLIDGTGRAVLVDLEKGRYGGCGFDLAHATLYTSTTWDTEVNIELQQSVIEKFYKTWLHEMPDDLAASMLPTLIAMRRMMWLWSVTWCARWRVESNATGLSHKHPAENTQGRVAQNRPDALVVHVEERTRHYLQEDVINKVITEFKTLTFI